MSLLTSDQRRRWNPANSLLLSMLATSLKVDPKIFVLLSFRSGILFSSEETSTLASLMARNISLGPSDALCRVETSTAHGDSFFIATVFSRKNMISWFSTSAADLVHSVLLSYLPSPEMSYSSQITPSPPVSRRILIHSWAATTKLGFLLLGPVPSFGPLTFLKLKPIILKSRSATSFILSTLRQLMCRYISLDGQGLLLRVISPSLLWSYNHLLRTMVLASSMALIFASKCLKFYGLLFSIPICRRFECVHGIMPSLHSMTILSSDFKYRPTTTFSKTWIMFLQIISDYLKRDPEPLFCVSKQASPDYIVVVTQILADALLRVDLLVPARITAPISSSTSPSLLTVTIMSSINLFVEDSSTNRDLTCVKTLFSLCLKALMESTSIFSYPFVALGNVFLCYDLNFGIFESFLSFVLGFI